MSGDGGRRRIWLCADDYGISPAVNVAIRDLVVRGRLNAVSVMVVAPSFHRAEALALAALNSVTRHALIGLHLVLTAPFRPASKEFEPLRAGAFLPLAATFTHGLLRRFRPDLLAAEFAAQLDAFVAAFARAPDFIDGHQHAHLFPQIGEAVLQAAREKAPHAWVRQCGRAAPWPARLADGKGLFLDLLSWRLHRRARALGVRTNCAFAGTYEFDDDVDFPSIFPRFLDGLPDGGLVMCHPGFVDAQLQRLDPLTTLREREYAFFAGDAFPALLEGHGVALALPERSHAGC
jgi:predicted glycoside hydrolase/deacetylase ChbG (UPF0249 family)